MTNRTWPRGIRGRGLGGESGITSKAKKSFSEAGLRSFSTSSHPDQWYQKPKYPPPMNGESSSSFSFCEDQDLTTAPPPSLSTGQFFTPGACSEHGTDVDKQPSSPKQPRKKPPRLARVKTEIDKLSELQRDLSRRRSQVGELRVGLGFKREEEVEARVAFMKKLNTLFVPNGTQDARPVAHEYEQLQSVTEEYLELERNYTVAEDELGMQEYELTLAMERLSGLLHRTSSSSLEEEENDDEDDYNQKDEFEDHDTMLVPPIMQTPMPPSMVEYLRCMGDLELLHERVYELDTEWMELSEKQKSRTQFDLPMDDDSLEFLDSYEEHRKQTVADIEKTILEANQLRAICQSQGLIPADQPQQQQPFNNDDDDDDEDDLALDNTSQEQLEEPLKISAMQESPHPFFEPSSMSTTKFDRSQFINKWILHQLRHSTFQIAKLKSLPELRELAEVEGFDEVSISRMAMDLWFMDDAVMVEPPGSPPFTEGGDDSAPTSGIEHGGAVHTLDLNLGQALQGNGIINTKQEEKDGNSHATPRRKSEPVRRPIYWTVQSESQNQFLGRVRSVSMSCGIL